MAVKLDELRVSYLQPKQINGNVLINGGTISYKTTNYTSTPIVLYDDTTTYGHTLLVGAGGTTYIGAGEAASGLYSKLGTKSSEILYLGADSNIMFHPGADSATASNGVVLDTNRYFYPQTTGSGSIGTTSCKWNSAYINDIYASHGRFTATSDASETANAAVALRLGPDTGQHIDIDGNEILSKSDAATMSTLYLQGMSLTSGGVVGTGTWQATKISLTYGGTGQNLSAMPAGAIVRNSTDGTGMWYSQSKSGALYSTGTNVAPVFGTLPVAQGGTGLTALVTPTVTWANGTSSGPTLVIKDSLNKSSTAQAIPKATSGQSGIVTTGDQTFGGTKRFAATPIVTNASYYASFYLKPQLITAGEDRLAAFYSYGATSSSSSVLTTSQVRIRQYSYTTNSTTALAYYDQFSLPATAADKTANNNYNILTTKNLITVAQGGTGANSAAGARTNLGTLSAISANGYYGMGVPDGSTNVWIRTTSLGIIPYQSGGASALGTSSWPFTNAYINTVYGNLTGNVTGNVSGSSGSCTGNAATATNADKLDGYHSSSFGINYNIGNADLNVQINSGFYRLGGTITNGFTNAAWGQMLVVHGGGDTIGQIGIPYNESGLYIRQGNPNDVDGAGSWKPWVRMLHSDNYTEYTVTKQGAGASGDWGINITGRAYTIKDSQSNSTITITYAKAGQSSTSWLASWNGYELGAIAPANITAGKATADSDGNTIKNTYLKLSGGTLTGEVRQRDGTNSTNYITSTVNTVGTTTETGIGRLTLGNSTATGTAGNARGRLSIYGDGAYCIHLQAHGMAASRYYNFQDHGKNVYAVGVASAQTAVGSETSPVYVNNKGIITACGTSLSDYLPLSGGTLSNQLVISMNSRYVSFGCHNSSFAHYNTDADVGHWFNKDVRVQGEIYAGSGYNQQVLHAGNYTSYTHSRSELTARGLMLNLGLQTSNATGWTNMLSSQQFTVFTNWWDSTQAYMPYIYGSGIMIPHLDANWRSFLYCQCNDKNLYYGYCNISSTTVPTWKKIWVQGDLITGAVWNDYAEYRRAETIEPGRVVQESKDGIMKITTERMVGGCEIISDTFGFAIGETDECKTPIAATGRVLAYPYEDRNTFELGQAVCAGPGGTVSRMSRNEIIHFPDRIIGTVSEIPDYETWGTGNVKVNGRIWIRIR